MQRFLIFVWLTSLVTSSSGCCPGCSPAAAEIIVDLRTDVVLGEEADEIVVRLDGNEVERLSARARDATSGPLRLGPYLTGDGRHQLETALLDAGTVVLERSVTLLVRGRVIVPVSLLRICRNTICPGGADDPAATECQDGRCVVPECVPDLGGGCTIGGSGIVEGTGGGRGTGPEAGIAVGSDGGTNGGVSPICVIDVECPMPTAACAVALCEDGLCLQLASDPEICEPTDYCNPDLGCVVRNSPTPPEVDPPPTSPGGPDPSMPIPVCCSAVCLVGGLVTRCCE